MMDISMYSIIDTSRGKDGVLIVLLDDTDFNHLVKRVIKRYEIREWYLEKHWRAVHRNTGIGYYPNGIAIDDTIYVRWKYRGDDELIAHEYGHTLGLGHTPDFVPSVMNPINSMRFLDPHKLRQKAKENFPTHYRKYVSPTEAYQNIVIGGTVLAALWGLR
tara:strand:- start:2015 stop:2497 length:483 start_codon:yes stop_codon:yes gene_type:complete